MKLFIFLSVLSISFAQINFCNPNLCRTKSGPHIACNNSGDFSSRCPAGTELIELTTDDENDIVDTHNEYRNIIASGQLPRYDPAVRMAKMQWSNQLARLAELNVRRCVYGHDSCRNTPRFKTSGQNLNQWEGNIARFPPKSRIRNAIDRWFNESADANMSFINNFRKSTLKIGHFTVMVVEQNTRVGCAAIQMPINERRTQILTACNYASNNINGRAIYRSGASSSDCQTGVDFTFTSLCSVDEVYD